MYKLIDQLNIHERRIFIRTDFNVPMKDGKIRDDTRIRESLPTIQYAISQGAKVIIGSHSGRPKGMVDLKYSLMPIAAHLSEILNKDILFPENAAGDAVKKLAHDLRPGEVMLLENLRFHPEEEANDLKFAEHLAHLAEVYVSDSFGTVHRAHASTAGMVSFFKEKGIGYLIQKELKFLEPLLTHPKKPFVAVLGGAKVFDKIGVIEHLMNHVDAFVIGGGMAYTFLKAKHFDVGRSLVDESKVHQAEKILERAAIKGVAIHLPVDSILAEKIEAGVPARVAGNGEDWNGLMGLDIGPKTIAQFSDVVRSAKTIFWNGPMGAFETPGFHKGTWDIALAIAESGAVTIVGGGDSVSAIRQAGYADRVTHLCTGGGAALEYLEGKKLPGLVVLEDKPVAHAHGSQQPTAP